MPLAKAYAFDEGSGTVAAEINGGTTITGIPGWDPGGRHGAAMRTNLQVGPTIAAFPASSAYTIMFDVYLVGNGNNAINMLLDGFVSEIGTLQQSVGGNLEWYPWLGPGSAAIPAATWTHVAAVASGTYRRILINGSATANVANTELSGTSPYILGGRSTYEANARFDNLRIYDEGLADAAVLALAGTPVTPLVQDEGSKNASAMRAMTGGRF